MQSHFSPETISRCDRGSIWWADAGALAHSCHTVNIVSYWVLHITKWNCQTVSASHEIKSCFLGRVGESECFRVGSEGVQEVLATAVCEMMFAWFLWLVLRYQTTCSASDSQASLDVALRQETSPYLAESQTLPLYSCFGLLNQLTPRKL